MNFAWRIDKLFELIPTFISLPNLDRLDRYLFILKLFIPQFLKSDHVDPVKRNFLYLILIFSLCEVSWICLKLRIDNWAILVDQGLELNHRIFDESYILRARDLRQKSV